MQVLVVPMNPEFLPEAAMLLAGVFAGAIAMRSLFARRIGRALGVGALGIVLIALAIVLGRSGRVHSPYGQHPSRPVSGKTVRS
jgi:hypothetical protein